MPPKPRTPPRWGEKSTDPTAGGVLEPLPRQRLGAGGKQPLRRVLGPARHWLAAVRERRAGVEGVSRTLWKAGGCRTERRACGRRKEAKVKPRASGGPRGGSRGSRQLRGPHAAAESTHWAGQHRSPPPRPWQGTRGAEVRLGVEEGWSWRPAAAAALAPGPAPVSPASLAATEGAGAGDVWNHQIFIYQKNPKRL